MAQSFFLIKKNNYPCNLQSIKWKLGNPSIYTLGSKDILLKIAT